MTIHERAVAALGRARAAAVPPPALDTAFQRRLRAALARDLVALFGVAPEHIVVADDPVRSYGAMPGQLIAVHDPATPPSCCGSSPSPATPAPAAAPTSCSAPAPHAATPTLRDVPILSIATLADLGHARDPLTGPHPGDQADLDRVPVEFFDDPAHTPDCSLR